jgi:acetyl-CoA carboxylase biotin carboxyl carrier protein
MPGINEDDLRWLLDLLEREPLAEIEVREGSSEVLLRAVVAAPAPGLLACAPVGAAPAPVGPDEAPLAENHLPVLSPMAGVFYRSSSPDAPPFAQEGDHVNHGDTVGLIEAMKLFNEIPAPATGTVLRFLITNEGRVEADQPVAIMEIDKR